MLKNLKKQSEGFTIIEVLIVLAIAGLIMLIVFLAVPALQRNQRNNARNSEASRMASAINECLSNRNGVTTATAQGCGRPANVEFGATQQLTALTLRTTSLAGTTDAAPATAGTTTAAEYQFGATCNSSAAGAIASTNTRSYVVLFQLEPAVTRCVGS